MRTFCIIFRNYLFVIILLAVIQQTTTQNLSDSLCKRRVPEDGRLNFTALAKKYGYKCEEYDAVTKDGYILKLFHIPGNVSRPVLLMHGFLDSSDGYIIRARRSLAALLADAGYDVWVGNSRGNRYSRRHTKLNPDVDHEFWDYSVHEYGTLDLPAMIDLILDKTGQSQLSYVGHSEGTTMMYVLGAQKAKYNDKIKLFVALAPVCYLHKSFEPIPVLLKTTLILNQLFKNFIHEIFGFHTLLKDVIDLICTQGAFSYKICAEGAISFFFGLNPEELEPSFLPIVIGHVPAGTSNKNMNHFAQILQRQQFAQYDYGYFENMKRYDSIDPPLYNLKNVNMKVALFVSKNDKYATLDNVKLLSEQLPNVVLNHVMEQSKWSHLDFTWGQHAYNVLYPKVLDSLNEYN